MEDCLGQDGPGLWANPCASALGINPYVLFLRLSWDVKHAVRLCSYVFLYIYKFMLTMHGCFLWIIQIYIYKSIVYLL